MIQSNFLITFVDPIAATTRIRPGQRGLIFHLADALGLRDEQFHDLIEHVSNYRTRSISRLSILEARNLIGLLKTIQRNSAKLAAAGRRSA